jgi:hypothetical protein
MLMQTTSLARLAILVLPMACCLPQTQAQTAGKPDASTPNFQTADQHCRTKVSKFEETIGFLRQTQGNAAAAEVKEKLLPAKLESEILFKDGYCGLARYLHEQKLDR